MKLARTLLYVAGAANALFFLFHLWLGWRIHQWQLLPGARATVEMLNGGSAFYCLLLAIASFAFTGELLATGLGRLLVTAMAVMYALRALAEFVVTPVVAPAIVGTCMATSLIYAVALFTAARARRSGPPSDGLIIG